MSEQVDLSTIPISPDGEKSSSSAAAAKSDEPVTVFHDKDNFNVKHPLANEWTLWFTKPASGKVSLRLFGLLRSFFANSRLRVMLGMIC